MNNKNKLRLFIVLVVLLVINTLVIVQQDKNHYMLQTSEGCCTVEVEHHDYMYDITYNDNITQHSEVVTVYTEYDAEWTIGEMVNDYCSHHSLN